MSSEAGSKRPRGDNSASKVAPSAKKGAPVNPAAAAGSTPPPQLPSDRLGAPTHEAAAAAAAAADPIPQPQFPPAPGGVPTHEAAAAAAAAGSTQPPQSPVGALGFLSAERREQLSKREYEAERTAAVEAIKHVHLRHPFRTLLEYLIADEDAWRSVYDEWQQLMKAKAKWEDLLLQLNRDGVDKVKDELLAYGLTRGAAAALLNKLTQPKCIPCMDNGRGAFYVASLENYFGPFQYWRVLVDSGCQSVLLTLSTGQKGSVHADDTVLRELRNRLPIDKYKYTLATGVVTAGRTCTLVVEPKDNSRFEVNLACDIAHVAQVNRGALSLRKLRFHVSAYDAARMRDWPDVQLIEVAKSFKPQTDPAAVLQAVVDSGVQQRSHVLLGMAVLRKVQAMVLHNGRLLLALPTNPLALHGLLQRDHDAAQQLEERFKDAVLGIEEEIKDWVDEDHDEFVDAVADGAAWDPYEFEDA